MAGGLPRPPSEITADPLVQHPQPRLPSVGPSPRRPHSPQAEAGPVPPGPRKPALGLCISEGVSKAEGPASLHALRPHAAG